MTVERITNGVRTLIDWTDVRRPSKRDLLIVFAAFAVYIVAVVVLNTAADVVLPSGEPAEHLTAEQTPPNVPIETVAVMLVSVWAVSALEEYTFRNLLQKLLYTWFHHGWAIVITSVIFAALHVPAYGGLAQSFTELLVPLSVVFVGSVILGYAYWRSKNIVVPTLVHGMINTLSLAVIVLR